MNLIENLKKLAGLGKSNAQTPKSLCPDCWGRQEYEGKFYDAVLKEKKDLGWIQNYAEENLKGITLKKNGSNYECPSCKIDYRPAD